MEDLIKDLKGYSLGELWEKRAKIMKDNYDNDFLKESTSQKTLTLETFYSETNREYIKINGLYYWRSTCEKLMEHLSAAFGLQNNII